MKRLLAVAMIVLAAGGAQKGASDGAAGQPAAGLDGVWRGWVVEGRGQQTDRGTVHLELTIKGNQISAKRLDEGGQSLGEGFFRVIPGRVVMMDATEARRSGRPRVYLGICQAQEDTIRWCVATPGIRRPTSFESKGQQFLLVLKRQP